jgi:cytidylate kinase
MSAIDIPVVAVDGPGGTGKGTLCVALAETLGWHLLDSGALYRVLAVAARKSLVSMVDEVALAQLARDLSLEFRTDEKEPTIKVILQGCDVTNEIRTEKSGNLASELAALPAVRAALLDRQLAFRREPGLVADGRDMGTVVFPEAILKIFLTASPEERARRRHKQLMEKGVDVNLAALLEDIMRRDARDAQRTASPLKPASDAIVLDTTSLGIAAVKEHVLVLLYAKGIAARPVGRID